MSIFPLVLLLGSCSFQTFEGGVDHPLSRRDVSLADAASAFVRTQLQIDSGSVKFKSGYSSDIVQYAYIKQQHNNISFANAVANVAFKDDKVVTFGHSFTKPTSIASSTPTIGIEAAISVAEETLDGTYNKIPTTLEYLVNPDNTVSLIHVVQVQNQKQDTGYEAFVDAHSGKFISAINLVAKAGYHVLPIYKQDVTQGLEFLVDPQNLDSSPLGWHNDGTSTSNDTSGNNVLAYLDQTQSATTSQSSDGLIFNYTQDPTLSPKTPINMDAARTNVFYVINSVHDTTYLYGFTESAFNFQQDNFKNGGVGGDRVLASVQNSFGTDNANFFTPPDGQSGQMNMYLWDQTDPNRDGGLANDIVTHETTHGLGEGWSDAMADWFEQDAAPIVDYSVGTYVNGGFSIRSRPYSTNSTVNPYTYSTVLEATEVHQIGEVWANMLHNVLAALVDAYGFSKTARTDPSGSEGNVVYLHLFIDGLALQHCNPDFLVARDAIIQADQNRYSGAHKCVLWKAFARSGLGFNAADFFDDFSVPSGC
ncbi:Extracellular metalloproteinase [Mycena venus]|uniref:Extracellular metalloproteinase n=1 Tax=Mycena venus TaxID=2733690 RepID=A0A8H6XKN4_9AGAR|nr:Extracellular metalloproteinase [Mycena venus]